LLKALTAKYGDTSAESLPDDLYYDFGSDVPFSLAGRGPGECGAGVVDVIKLDIDEAKDALKSDPAANEDIYGAIVASARSLLVTKGLEPKKDREIFAAFSEHLIEPGWVKSATAELLDDAIDWRMGDRESLDDRLAQARELSGRVEELFLSLDAGLKFKIGPAERKVTAEKADEETHTADLRGVACPLNFVKAKLELEKIEVGAVLDVLLDEGEPVRNVPVSFADQGQEVVEVKDIGGHFRVKVRRKK
jgi:sulfite reductase (ferredoxin)